MEVLGGFGDARPADEEIKSLVTKVKTEVEGKLGKKLRVFEAVSYSSQVVCGTNYVIKVKVGENEYVHIKIFEALPCYGGKVELNEVEGGKTLADAL